MKYSAPLDGIRAIAIVAVLVFHVFPKVLQGGFTGVDVFFVLSGFLITSIILADIRNKSFSLREFYLRRIQRLLPNGVLTVLVVLILSSFILPPSSLQQTGWHGLWALANLSNFFIWRNLGGYWGGASNSAPLLHTWSLAVEEQFYLLFPTFMVLIARYQTERITRWLLAASALSLGLCLYATPGHPAASFYMLPTRVWELLLGGALASYITPLRTDDSRPLLPSPLLREMAGWIGIFLIVSGFLAIAKGDGFPGAKALVPTIGTVLLIFSVTAETTVSRFLSIPFMVRTGKLSYSIYLWHWPLITLGRVAAEARGVSAFAGAAAGAGSSIVVAYLVYKFVEQPLRSRGPGRRWRLAIIAAGFLIAIVWSGSVAHSRSQLDTSRYFDQPEFHGVLYSVGKLDAERQMHNLVGYRDLRIPTLDGRSDDAWRSGGIMHQFGEGGAPQVVVLGSSHAMMYSRVIDEICRKLRLRVAFLCVDATPAFFKATVNDSFPTVRDAREFDASRQRWLRTWRPQAVFAIDRWDLLVDDEQGFGEEFRTFARQVAPLTNRLFFVSQVPVLAGVGDGFNLRELMTMRINQFQSIPSIFPDSEEPKRKRAVAAAEAEMSAVSNLRVLRPDRAFYNQDGSIRWVSGRTVYYLDDDHLTDAGAMVVSGLFQEAIQSASVKSETSAAQPR